jgi:TolB-like protein/Flp pilus assembly protein TadD
MTEEASRSSNRIAPLWRRTREHKVVEWGVTYVALAYAIQHAIVLTSEAFEWPHEVSRISMLALALGLPVAMALAWYHGGRAARRVSGPELTVIAILLVIASLLFYVFARPSQESEPGLITDLGVVSVLMLTGAVLFVLFLRAPENPARAAASSLPVQSSTAPMQPSVLSVAVLPFLNLSRDLDQEFFSDGMTEEITAALAQVKGLRVVGRTSAFQFKGGAKDLRAIGHALGATHLIEGSVRKAGNRVRITAQLIRAEDDTHLWAQNYDRELIDVFAVQEEIAQAIAGALHVPLGLQVGERLVSHRIGDTESYEDYLRARALFRARSMTQAIAVLEPVTARNATYTPAWGLLASAYTLVSVFNSSLRIDPEDQARRATQLALAKAERAAQQAITIDAANSTGHAGLGFVRYVQGRWSEAEILFKRALSLDPNDPDALHIYGNMLADAGYTKEALQLRHKLQRLEPFVPIYNVSTAGMLQIDGQNAAAIALLEATSPEAVGGFYRNVLLARAYAAVGRFEQAADTLMLIKSALVSDQSVEDAARLIRSGGLKAPPQQLPSLQGELGFVYAHCGADDRLLDFTEREIQIGYFFDLRDTVWLPNAAPARKTHRFKVLMRKSGLVDYWRLRGWPDLCRAAANNDFDSD